MDTDVQNDWHIVNVKHAGFYRVNYDEVNWNLLTTQLKKNHSLIDSTSRAAILDDSFNLGKGELINQIKFLEIASYLKAEQNPLVYKAALPGLEYIRQMLAFDQETLKKFDVNYSEKKF